MDTKPDKESDRNGAENRHARKQKLTAVLDRHRSIITTGVDSTMDAYLAAICELLRRASAAKKQGIGLPTLLSILRDQARRE